MPHDKKLTRSKTDQIIAGVCGGLGDYLEIDSVFIRLAFVLLTFFGGVSILVYLIMFLIVPEEESESLSPLDNRDYFKDKKLEIKEIMEHNKQKGKVFGGIFLILLGFLFLLDGFAPAWFSFGRLWPIILIALGVYVLVEKRKS